MNGKTVSVYLCYWEVKQDIELSYCVLKDQETVSCFVGTVRHEMGPLSDSQSA